MTIPTRNIDNQNIAVKQCKHGLFSYLKNDTFIGRSLDIYGEWTEPEIEHLTQLILPNSVVIDVGAFIGTHSIAFAKAAGRNGFVYAFEPQRIAYNLLCANIALNNLLNVKSFNAGLGDKPGKVFIPLLDPTVRQNFGALDINRFTEGDIVQVTTIDNLNLQRCNLIKVDVEGMEEKVLKGGENTIKKYKPVLYIENNRKENSGELIKTVYKLGYKAYWDILDYYNPMNFFGNKRNVFKNILPEANLLCIPVDSGIKLKGFSEVNGQSDDWEKALDRLAKKHKTKI